MIVRMQRLQVKQAIINLSKQKGSMNYRGMRVWIYPDLTSEENWKRTMFNDVRKKLCEVKVHHGITHPATLITFKGETKSFSSSKDAETHFNKDIKPTLLSESCAFNKRSWEGHRESGRVMGKVGVTLKKLGGYALSPPNYIFHCIYKDCQQESASILRGNSLPLKSRS